MSIINTKSQIASLQNLLRVTYGLVPIVAGLDKFTNFLTDWSEYLHPVWANMMGASSFMMIVG